MPSSINESAVAHLRSDPTSVGSIQKTGCGDASRIMLSNSARGTIGRTDVVCTNTTYPQGEIYIGNATLIGIECMATFGNGPLTEVYIRPEFAVQGFTAGVAAMYRQAALLIGAGGATSTLAAHTYVIGTTDEKYAFAIKNPGANYMRIKVASTGSTTGTSDYLDLYVSRGWGNASDLFFK